MNRRRGAQGLLTSRKSQFTGKNLTGQERPVRKKQNRQGDMLVIRIQHRSVYFISHVHIFFFLLVSMYSSYETPDFQHFFTLYVRWGLQNWKAASFLSFTFFAVTTYYCFYVAPCCISQFQWPTLLYLSYAFSLARHVVDGITDIA